jgi:hypothetical protein
VPKSISVGTFLWARATPPQKCPCPNCCGYSYNLGEIKKSHPELAVKSVVSG